MITRLHRKYDAVILLFDKNQHFVNFAYQTRFTKLRRF